MQSNSIGCMSCSWLRAYLERCWTVLKRSELDIGSRFSFNIPTLRIIDQWWAIMHYFNNLIWVTQRNKIGKFRLKQCWEEPILTSETFGIMPIPSLTHGQNWCRLCASYQMKKFILKELLRSTTLETNIFTYENALSPIFDNCYSW